MIEKRPSAFTPLTVATPPAGSALAAICAMFSTAREDGLFIAWGSIAQFRVGRTWANTPWASFSSSRESKFSAEADAPNATRVNCSRSANFLADEAIRFMASSRMSWAEGSSSRSRPETMALAGLMKS